MERRLEAATRRGARVLIVRAGDFFGPQAGNNWFSQGLVKPGKPVTTVSLPGDPGVGHQWAYLPDVAETMVRLLERLRHAGPFARFHLAGHWDADGTRMVGGDPPRRRAPHGRRAGARLALAAGRASPRPSWRCCARSRRCATCGGRRCG